MIGLILFFIHLLLFSANGDHERFKEPEPGETSYFPPKKEIPDEDCTAYDGSKGGCRPAILCDFRFESPDDVHTTCTMASGKVGVCCPSKPPSTRVTVPPRTAGPPRVSTLFPSQSSTPKSTLSDDSEEYELRKIRPAFQDLMPDISPPVLDKAAHEGVSDVQKIDLLETEFQSRGILVKHNSPEFFLDVQFLGDKDKAYKMGRDGLKGIETTLKIINLFPLLSPAQRQYGLVRFSLAKTEIADTCPKTSSCLSTKYRTSDGSCNNLRHPEWGKAFQPYARVLPPRYADRVNLPRVAKDGGPLPSPREVSQRVTSRTDRPSQRVTVAFVVWAQFLAYDLSQTAVTTAGHGKGIHCCFPEGKKPSSLKHPACLPLLIPQDDPIYLRHNRSCMHFLRSVPAPKSDCTLGPREQLNQVTAFIDGSGIYGSSDETTNALRSFEGGKLKWSAVGGEEMLLKNWSIPCGSGSDDTPCFSSGDKRSNQNVLLTVMHGVMLREHNRIAEELSRLNHGWNDEILFRETRRLLGAQIQHITYNEFLPLLLGKRVMSSYELYPKTSGFSFDYDDNLNPAIINSFATAANRYGHTLVQEKAEMYSREGVRRDFNTLNSFDPSLLYRRGSFDDLVRGIIQQPAQAFDTQVSHQLIDHLFNNGSGPGLDLIALNIQRGRDHGLPGYNEWREYCGLSHLRDFEELAEIMHPDTARDFSKLYTSVDDIDLYPAGIAENPLPDAILGPTFACIIAEQFRRLKIGDRFWYENEGLESSLREDQLQEIRKHTFSRLLCDNTNVNEMQLVAFVKPAKWNPTEDCKRGDIPKMILRPWKNEPVWT